MSPIVRQGISITRSTRFPGVPTGPMGEGVRIVCLVYRLALLCPYYLLPRLQNGKWLRKPFPVCTDPSPMFTIYTHTQAKLSTTMGF